MYAQIDDIIFEPVSGFNSFSDSEEAIWAEHAFIQGKPSLQPTANGLREANITIRLNQEFINVAEAYAALLDKVRNHIVCPLIWGNGNVEGNFAITNISRTLEEQDHLGNIFSKIVTLSLKEYDVQDPLQIQQQLARQAAAAVGDVSPIIRRLPERRDSVFQYWIGQYNKYLAKVRQVLGDITSRINTAQFRYDLQQVERCLNSFQNLDVLTGAADLRAAINGIINGAIAATRALLNVLPVADPTGISSTVKQRFLSTNNAVVTAMAGITPVVIVPPTVVAYSGKRKVNAVIYAGKSGAKRMRSLVNTREITDTFNATMAKQAELVKKSLTELFAIAQPLGEDTDASLDFLNAVGQAKLTTDALIAVLPIADFTQLDIKWPAFEEAMQKVYETSVLWTMALVTRRERIYEESGVGYWAVEIDLMVS